MKTRHYCVYILASRTRVLYTGVTGYLERRLVEHKTNAHEGFSAKYNVQRLVYYEIYGEVHAAIAREKEIKGWRREKKVKLIESVNPGWKDRAEEWFKEWQEAEKALQNIRS
jgi:putative endonuclease